MVEFYNTRASSCNYLIWSENCIYILEPAAVPFSFEIKLGLVKVKSFPRWPTHSFWDDGAGELVWAGTQSGQVHVGLKVPWSYCTSYQQIRSDGILSVPQRWHLFTSRDPSSILGILATSEPQAENRRHMFSRQFSLSILSSPLQQRNRGYVGTARRNHSLFQSAAERSHL